MLNIEIVSGNPDGSLNLNVYGRHSNGNNEAKRNWQVHWRVISESNVQYIADIKMKTGAGAPRSTDIFSGSGDQPGKHDSHGKHWKAKVNGGAPIHAEYNYDIKWVGEWGEKTYDPKISVKPSLIVNFPTLLIIGIISSIATILAIGLWSKKIKR